MHCLSSKSFSNVILFTRVYRLDLILVLMVKLVTSTGSGEVKGAIVLAEDDDSFV